jgi:SsrA-binding protein
MKLIKSNKKAFFDYEIIKDYEAGIVLSGSEVKSIKQGNVNLKGTFLKFYDEELFLLNMHIGTYQPAGQKQHEKEHNRKLLLNKKQLTKLFSQSQIDGNTLVPLEIYENNKSLIKVKIALVRGKKKHEKKQIIKERDQKREIARKLKNY